MKLVALYRISPRQGKVKNNTYDFKSSKVGRRSRGGHAYVRTEFL